MVIPAKDVIELAKDIANGTLPIPCTKCGTEVEVTLGATSAKCPKCGDTITIEWSNAR